MKYKLIACDVGANFALAHNLKGLKVCHWTFEGIRDHRQAQLLTTLQKKIAQINQLGHVHALVYERPFARGLGATRSLWGMAGIIEAVATNAGLAVLDVNNTSIKTWATGDGKASKADMIKAARKLGYKGNNEHEADAVCLLRYSEENVEIPE